MVSSGLETIGFILTWISLIHGLIACVISTLMVVVIIYYGHHNRLKHEEKITLILSANIYLAIFMYAVILSVTNIETLLGDLYGDNLYSSWCVFKGYWIIVVSYIMYHTFVIQAVFRLFRIVYSNYRWLQSFWIFVISTPTLMVLGSVLMCPALVWHDIVYIQNNHYCFVLLTQVRGIFWSLSMCYLVPYTCLLAIYIRITFFFRQQANSLVVAMQQRRQQRDLVAVRRIYINVALLCSISLPGIVMIIISLITDVEHPLSHRILWLGAEVSVAALSIELIFTTPQLKNIILRRWQRNRVATTEGSVAIVPVTTT